MNEPSPREDIGGEVRKGEELDAAKVTAWLCAHVDVTGEPKVTQYSGGASNWTYRLEWDERSGNADAHRPVIRPIRSTTSSRRLSAVLNVGRAA